jgi:hypothetical protein
MSSLKIKLNICRFIVYMKREGKIMVAVELVGVREAPLQDTKVLVEDYLKRHFKKERQVYPSDVADALGLEYEAVRRVFVELEKEGKLVESR